MISAEVICDSISHAGKRITTFKLRYPKFIHGEFMTHRVISRNASSSRAIPIKKLVEEVMSESLRAAPVFWGANQKGMQAAEELSDVEGHPDGPRSEKFQAQCIWAYAAKAAADHAIMLEKIGTHKQIVNRILEPFSHINVIATATEWDNFFGLRLHKDADPTMQALAKAMWHARQASEPRLLQPGEWHLPFVWKEGGNEEMLDSFLPPGNKFGLTPLEQMLRVSFSRCARVSYESFETRRRSTVEEDLDMYNRLLAGLSDPMNPLHASPAEHQATPDVMEQHSGVGYEWRCYLQHGNFIGWRQYRKMLPGESCAPLPTEYQS